jgi:glycosyltransferase involved in cell wall biosynthesis
MKAENSPHPGPAGHPASASPPPVHAVSLVVPVYQGERTLEALVAEVEPLVAGAATPGGRRFQVAELIFVHDGAIDGSHRVMEALARRHGFVRLIWLSRNYGQHPATLAGMASSAGEWVVTLDEDGQQNPADIGAMLDVALDEGAPLVYAHATNEPPHGWLRNFFSATVKWLFVRVLGNRLIGRFNSFRLIDGEIARSLAAYCGSEVFLDVALSWVVRESARCPVSLRDERGRRSGYTYKRLFEHMWRMLLTSGTKPLRFISMLGGLTVLLGLAISGYALYEKLTAHVPVQGWTSLTVLVCLFSGVILFALGVIAEYVGVTLRMAMGRPLYLIVSKPSHKERDQQQRGQAVKPA